MKKWYLFCKVFISDLLKCIFGVYFSECYYFDISTKVSLSAAENITPLSHLRSFVSIFQEKGYLWTVMAHSLQEYASVVPIIPPTHSLQTAHEPLVQFA